MSDDSTDTTENESTTESESSSAEEEVEEKDVAKKKEDEEKQKRLTAFNNVSKEIFDTELVYLRNLLAFQEVCTFFSNIFILLSLCNFL